MSISCRTPSRQHGLAAVRAGFGVSERVIIRVGGALDRDQAKILSLMPIPPAVYVENTLMICVRCWSVGSSAYLYP